MELLFEALDAGKRVDVIYTDVSKALDQIPHDNILVRGRGKMVPLFSPKPYYGSPPQRRYDNGFAEGVSSRQRFANASRQFQSEYDFGKQPGSIEQETGTELQDKNQGSKIPLKSIVNSSNTNFTTTIETTTTTTTKPTTTATTTTETTTTTTTTKPTTTTTTTKTTSTNPTETTTTTNPNSPATADSTLNYQTNENVTKNNGNELEVAQAAEELERERSFLRGTSKRPKYLCRTTKSDHSGATLCLGRGRVCKQEKPQLSGTVRFRGTTRMYLSRSSRPMIPLPENNAYCFTNPESALCRTFI
ncbi:unnamed protein product [Parnassius apollo]|uniref:(apollo) hypothetical protein n=1 Tax=Parnassius apollo TaxID=110799 RepID=A0A8S3X7Z4_PARAO|nr:unnamed protein product [Parnassius apollo]